MNNYINNKTSAPLFFFILLLLNWNNGFSQNNLMLSGKVTTEYGRGITDVIIDTTSTDTNGEYLIDTSIPTGGGYTIAPKKTTNYLNGIATDDMIGISKVILGIEIAPSPYRLLAADLNRSGSVTTFDLVVLRKALLLGPVDTASFDYDWRFISSDFIFPNLSNPFGTAIPRVFTINNPDTISGIDFIGYKAGDFTGNAAPNLFAESEDRSYTDELSFTFEDHKFSQGETKEIILKAADDLELNGFQFSLQFDPAAMEVLSLEAAEEGLEETHAGMQEALKGKIHILAYQATGKSIEAKDGLIKLTIRAKREINLSEVLQIGQSHLQAEIYQTNKEVAKLKLEYKATPTAINTTSKSGAYPNPFQNQTTLNFNLPLEGLVTLTITDQAGRLISQQSKFMQAGQQQWALSAEVLNTEKLFFYRLDGPNLQTNGCLVRQQ